MNQQVVDKMHEIQRLLHVGIVLRIRHGRGITNNGDDIIPAVHRAIEGTDMITNVVVFRHPAEVLFHEVILDALEDMEDTPIPTVDIEVRENL